MTIPTTEHVGFIHSLLRFSLEGIFIRESHASISSKCEFLILMDIFRMTSMFGMQGKCIIIYNSS